MRQTDAEERAFLRKRAADHEARAAAAQDDALRALHLRFAALYLERAEERLVEDDQPPPA